MIMHPILFTDQFIHQIRLASTIKKMNQISKFKKKKKTIILDIFNKFNKFPFLFNAKLTC